MLILPRIKVLCWIFYGMFFINHGYSLSDMCPIQPCSLKQYSFSKERDSMENHALYGYVFENLTVSNHKNCFEHCAWDCRCMSFNFVTTARKKNCQLNEQNRHLKPGALKRAYGHSYHEIGIDYNIKPGTKCTHCYNGCCRGNVHCLNGGTCQEVCDSKRFRCKCRPLYKGTYCSDKVLTPKSCAEIRKNGGTSDGVYTIDPDGKGAFQIFCNQSKDGEAWAVIQRRLDGSVDFYRGWEDYKRGFGDLRGEFWLGLENIHRLTNQAQQKLRIEMEDFTGFSCWIEYDNFVVNGEDDGYRLAGQGYNRGSCRADSLSYSVGAAFSTRDKDADTYPTNCAVAHQGAWWYKACTQSNLNGKYNPTSLPITGIYWYRRQNNIVLLKRVEMKLQLLG